MSSSHVSMFTVPLLSIKNFTTHKDKSSTFNCEALLTWPNVLWPSLHLKLELTFIPLY